MHTRRQVVFVNMSALFLLTACTNASDNDASAGPSLAQFLLAQNTSAAYDLNFGDIHDLVVPSGREGDQVADLVMVGEVSGVEAGVSGKFTGHSYDEEGEWVLTDFDDPDAMSRTFHITVAVDETLGTTGSEAVSHVVVGLAAGPTMNVEEVDSALREMGRTIWFLEESPVYEYSPSVHYGVIGNGMLLGTVDSAGVIALPFVEEDMEIRLLGEYTTLESLGG